MPLRFCCPLLHHFFFIDVCFFGVSSVLVYAISASSIYSRLFLRCFFSFGLYCFSTFALFTFVFLCVSSVLGYVVSAPLLYLRLFLQFLLCCFSNFALFTFAGVWVSLFYACFALTCSMSLVRLFPWSSQCPELSGTREPHSFSQEPGNCKVGGKSIISHLLFRNYVVKRSMLKLRCTFSKSHTQFLDMMDRKDNQTNKQTNKQTTTTTKQQQQTD